MMLRAERSRDDGCQKMPPFMAAYLLLDIMYTTEFRLTPPSPKPLPFINWIGGKRRLVFNITGHFTECFNTYWEPFLGGGAVFFAISDFVERAIISDIDQELITTYIMVRDQPLDLIESLHDRWECHFKDEDYFYEVRKETPYNDVLIASRFIYFTKASFGAKLRRNEKGEYTQSKNDRIKPLDHDNIMNCSYALRKADIRLGSYADIVNPNQGDLIYCDPPYDGSNGFYTDEFLSEDQIYLRDKTIEWMKKGSNVVISNYGTNFIRNTYSRSHGFNISEITTNHAFNTAADVDQRKEEIIITSY